VPSGNVPFHFGSILTPGQGAAATFDLVDLPGVMANIRASSPMVGGISTNLIGGLTIDRVNIKRKWEVQLRPHLAIESWWPVLRFWEQGVGSFLFVDHTRPNKLRPLQRVGQGWYYGATPLTPRVDGALVNPAATSSQMGLSSNPVRANLAPVTAGTTYWCGGTFYSVAAFAVTGQVAWWGTTGASPISTTTLFTGAGSSSGTPTPILDGSISGRRIGLAVAAPAGATYAQLIFTATTGTFDIIDPTICPGATDPGNETFLVAIMAAPDESHNHYGYASFPLSLAEM
jgi:hypothetical protein